MDFLEEVEDARRVADTIAVKFVFNCLQQIFHVAADFLHVTSRCFFDSRVAIPISTVVGHSGSSSGFVHWSESSGLIVESSSCDVGGSVELS